VTSSPTTTPTIILSPTSTPEPTATPLGGGFGQIAFASDRAGLPQIFLIDSNGNHPMQITSMANGACQPAWSPNGLRLVFISPCRGRSDLYPGSGLFIVNADGTGLTPLPTETGGDFDPAWSPDGSRIAFTSLRDGNSQLVTISLADLSITRLTEANSDIQSRQPAWSPDGTKIVFTVKRVGVLQIWLMDASGSGATQLVRSGIELWDYLPAWSPDGVTVLFTQSRAQQTLGWLKSIRYAQRDTAIANYLANGQYAMDATYSPDGMWLAFESSDSLNYDIYVMGVDGRGRVKLTADVALDFDPAWRPINIP